MIMIMQENVDDAADNAEQMLSTMVVMMMMSGETSCKF